MIGIYFILTSITLGSLFLKLFNYPLKDRYRQWYLPIILFLEALFFIYKYNSYSGYVQGILILLNLSFLKMYFELIYVFVCMLIMLGTKLGLKTIKIDLLLQKLLPGFLSFESKYNDTFICFPYIKEFMESTNIFEETIHQEKDNEVPEKDKTKNETFRIKGRPGLAYLSMFFGLTLISVVVLIAYSLLIGIKIDYYLTCGLFAFSIPVIAECYNFYKTNVLPFEETPVLTSETSPLNENEIVDLYSLWKDYTQLFPSAFDIAFVDSNPNNKQIAIQNEQAINTLLSEFKSGRDIIVEDLDIPTSFNKLSGLLLDSLANGGNILILVDIPDRHVVKSEGRDIAMMELFTSYLSDCLQNNGPASGEILKLSYIHTKAGKEQFKSRIILATVSTILESNIAEIEWFDDLDLLFVINFSDQSRVNFFENQKFNLLISQKNNSFHTAIMSPLRQGLQAALTKTWVLGRTHEKRLTPVINAQNHYCIISNFEKWHENWLKVATPIGTGLYSGIEFAIPAIHYGLKKISYIEIRHAEVREGIEGLGTSRNYIKETYNLSGKDLDRIIQMNLLPFFMFEQSDQQFSIIYDTENNSPEIYSKWLHLGEQDNFTIIISKPYLFKSYFADNFLFFKRTPVLSIQPMPSFSKINLTILLYNLLSEKPVSEYQIKKIANDYDVNSFNISTPVLLRDLFIRYFNFDIEENSRLQVEEVAVFNENGFEKSYLYSLAPFQINHFPQFAPLRTVQLIDNRGIQRFTILKDLLFQNYLPKQKHVFNGRTYEIISYDESAGIMSIRNLTQFNNHLFYQPCFRIHMTQQENDNLIIDKETHKLLQSELNLIQFESSFDLETYSYYEFRGKYQAITSSNYHEVLKYDLDPKDFQMVKRSYRNSRVMKLEWKPEKQYLQHIPKLQTGLHLLLFEAFKTFFPYRCQYLIICSTKDGLNNEDLKEVSNFPWIFPELSNMPNQEYVEIYIIEDSTSDMGVLNAITENYVYIFKYLYDYLCWISEENFTENENQLPETSSVMDYINNINDKTDFLRYGFDQIPVFLDIPLLKSFAEIHFPLDHIEKKELQEVRKNFYMQDKSQIQIP